VVRYDRGVVIDLLPLMTKQKTKLIEVLKKLTKGAGISVELPVLRLLRYIPIPAIQEIFNANEVCLDRSIKRCRTTKELSSTYYKVQVVLQK